MTVMKGRKMAPGINPGFVWLILLVLKVMQVLSAGCPPQCSCEAGPLGTVVQCAGQDFFQVPEGFPSDTSEIDLSNNDIPVLASSTFPHLTKLSTLVMDSCNVKRLEDYAFMAFPLLVNLTLTNNVIDTMGPNSFRNLPNLKHLHLDNNRIQAVPSLYGLNLQDLTLASNGLNHFKNISFQGSTIVNVNLNANNFSQISAPDLTALKDSLKTFRLSYNARQLHIDHETFLGFHLDGLYLRSDNLRDSSFLKNVKTNTLDISGNAFDSLDFSPYKNLNTVEVLYAQNIHIQFLELETLLPFIGLRYLNLANTSLLMFKGEILSRMPKLQTLIMEDNPFIMLPSDLGRYVPSLRELRLARSHVMTLNPETFESMNNLTVLDIRRNKVQFLPESLKPVLLRLTFLGLDENPFHCNCEMLWFWQLEQSSSQNVSNYTCNSPAKMTFAEATADNFRCSAPRFINSKDQITSLVGENVLLTCIAEGDPPPEVEWEAPTGEILRITPSYNRTMYKTFAIWRLKQVEVARAGLYKCKARNILGTKYSETQLHVVTSLTSFVSTQVPSNISENVTANATTIHSMATEALSSTDATTNEALTTEQTTANDDSVITQSTSTLPSSNFPYSNASASNFSVELDSSDTPEQALNLTYDTSTDVVGVNNADNKNSLVVKIIIIVCCAVGLVFLIVVIIVIIRQRQHSQKYDVSTTSFDTSNREHLTNGLNPKPSTLSVDLGDEKQKLTGV